MKINENHVDRTQSIISTINHAPDESYPVVTVDNRGPQKYSALAAFVSIPCATSSVGDQEGNISYKPRGSGNQATFLAMQLKKCF